MRPTARRRLSLTPGRRPCPPSLLGSGRRRGRRGRRPRWRAQVAVEASRASGGRLPEGSHVGDERGRGPSPPLHPAQGRLRRETCGYSYSSSLLRRRRIVASRRCSSSSSSCPAGPLALRVRRRRRCVPQVSRRRRRRRLRRCLRRRRGCRCRRRCWIDLEVGRRWGRNLESCSRDLERGAVTAGERSAGKRCCRHPRPGTTGGTLLSNEINRTPSNLAKPLRGAFSTRTGGCVLYRKRE